VLTWGSTYELEGKADQAAEQFQKCLRLKPWDETARTHLAMALQAINDRMQAMAHSRSTSG